MGRSPALDSTRSASIVRVLAALPLVLTCILTSTASGQTTPAAALDSRTRQLFVEDRWPEIVEAVEAVSERTADQDYYYGTALAKLGRLKEARQAFLAGHSLRPRDARFAVELGGVEFLDKRYSKAADWLRKASRVSPNDAYVNNFCGSVYFLQGNLDAALKYWNRVGKPRVENVRSEPVPRLAPSLLDRTFAFAPASTLRLPELWVTEDRLQGLGIFPNNTFTLSARRDEKFDLAFHAHERNGWGDSRLEALLSTFRGVFYQTLTPEYYNIGNSATNVQSLLRWDAQKRRALVSLSGPLERNPRWRYRVAVDVRDENWAIRESFTGPAPPLASLNLRREGISATVTSFNSARWSWSTGAELSYRDLRDVNPGSTLPSELLHQGFQLKHIAQFKYYLLRLPERRLTVTAGASTETGRLWTQGDAFFKPQASLATHWFPRPKGDDYEMQQQVRVGDTFGQVPFDELFMLGLERDN